MMRTQEIEEGDTPMTKEEMANLFEDDSKFVKIKKGQEREAIDKFFEDPLGSEGEEDDEDEENDTDKDDNEEGEADEKTKSEEDDEDEENDTDKDDNEEGE